MVDKVSVVLPPSMFIDSPRGNPQFVAYVLKSPRKEDLEYVFYVDAKNKMVIPIILTEGISSKFSYADFSSIDFTQYNVFYEEGDEEWEILFSNRKNAKKMLFKGSSYITGNIYKNGNGDWSVLPVKMDPKEIENSITFLS
jgi:hypothetical protein